MTKGRGRRRHLASRKLAPLQPSNELLLRLLQAYATRRGLSLTQLAAKLGVTYSMVDKWRSGDSLLARSSEEVVTAISKLLGVPQLFVRVMAGALTLDAFSWPGDRSIEASVLRQIVQAQGDWLTGKVPHGVAQRHRLLRRYR